MSNTPLLDIFPVAEAQNQKEAVINAAVLALEGATQAGLAVDCSAGNVVLTSAQLKRYFRFYCSGHTAQITLTIPTTARFFAIRNGGTGAVIISTGLGTTVSLQAAGRALLFSDGTDVDLLGSDGGSSGAAVLAVKEDGTLITQGASILNYAAGFSAVYVGAGQVNVSFGPKSNLQIFFPGVPSTGQLLWRAEVDLPFDLPANLANSRGRCRVQPAVNEVISILKNAAAAATATFTVGSTAATLATTGGAIISYVAGDIIEVYADNPTDGSIADISLTLRLDMT